MCYTLTPGIVHQNKPAVFEPKDISPVAFHSFLGSQVAGVYTRSQLSSFRDSSFISAASRSALRKFSQNNPGSFRYYDPRSDFFKENMISPRYFIDRFMDTVGPVVYVIGDCGVYFLVLVFLKLLVDVESMVIGHLDITKTTAASIGFGETFFSASSNFFSCQFRSPCMIPARHHILR